MDRLEQLEALLNHAELSWEEDTEITILPNGEIKAKDNAVIDTGNMKPLTFRENLGGEYALA